MNYRNLRVSNLIQEKLNELILKEVEFEGALVTITGVEVSRKLSKAKVRISVIPSEKQDEALGALNRERRKLQWLLLRKINIKPMPEIYFEIDKGVKNASDIEKILINEHNKSLDV